MEAGARVQTGPVAVERELGSPRRTIIGVESQIEGEGRRTAMEARPCVLVAAGATALRSRLAEMVSARGCRILDAATGGEALRAGEGADVAVVSLDVPDVSGLRLVEQFRQRYPDCPMIVLVAPEAVQDAVQAVRLGAEEVVPTPLQESASLEQALDRILDRCQRSHRPSEVAALAAEVGLVLGINPAMWRTAQLAHRVAATQVNVLIQGETGTGKEMFARFIHRASNRADRPFVAVNCGALPENLLESELFGHERGAFTGANQTRRGIFEIADKGTLFLDEVGEASHSVQVKLLRLLETRRFRRVGGEQELKSDVRIIAATNVPLEEAVKAGKFRADLFYRLEVVSLHLPPLRERPEDIPVLADYFLRRAAGNAPVELSPEALSALCSYHWPGNVRELNNAITRAVAIVGRGVITPEHLPTRIRSQAENAGGREPAGEPAEWLSRLGGGREPPPPEVVLEAWMERYLRSVEQEEILNLDELMGRWEDAVHQASRTVIRRVLSDVRGDREEAARRLGITVRRLRYLLNEKRTTAV